MVGRRSRRSGVARSRSSRIATACFTLPRTIGWARAIHNAAVSHQCRGHAQYSECCAQASACSESVYTSSVATIGIPADGSPGDERTPVALGNMIGHYKRSKYLAEEVVREAARMGMSVVIVNPSTPVGPGDVKPTPTGQLVLDAASGRMPAYVDTGTQHRACRRRRRRTSAGVRARPSGGALHLGRRGHDACGRFSPRSRGWSDADRRASACPTPRCCRSRIWRRASPELSGRSGRITLEGVRMSRKRMYFSSAKAVA